MGHEAVHSTNERFQYELGQNGYFNFKGESMQGCLGKGQKWQVLKCFKVKWWGNLIVVTYEIRVFFKGAQKEVFSSIFLKAQKNV